jgi:type II secretory ATPase GspE/PulE/Tfp pilus assembly ATPase PilB-like protein
LLLATLHTNDAPTAIPRLLDMGTEPYLLASTLSMIVAQRLVRRICMHCRETVRDPSEGLAALARKTDFANGLLAPRRSGVLADGDEQLSEIRLFHGKGCEQCNGTGYLGRVGVFEILAVSDAVRRMIYERRDATTIRAAALEDGMCSMFQDGLSKVFIGETTVEELLRVAT